MVCDVSATTSGQHYISKFGVKVTEEEDVEDVDWGSVAGESEEQEKEDEVLEAEMNAAAAAAEAAAQAADTEEAREERAKQMQEAEKNKEYKEMWNDFIATMRDSLEELNNMSHVCKLEPRSLLLD